MARKAREDMNEGEPDNTVQTEAPHMAYDYAKVVPIRELLSLTKEQREGLVIDGMSKILKVDGNSLDGGMIPCIIKYKRQDKVVNTLFRIDSRLVSEAWNYYKENADEPTAEQCIDYISKICSGPERVFKRLIPLDWC